MASFPFQRYSFRVALPETIPVRYTEEEAESLSVRLVVRQTFRMHQLLDMVLGVTGKDLGRIQQILRSGTIVFHFYRYWWQGLEADAQELGALLAQFPEADPARAFRPEQCTMVLLEGRSHPRRDSLELRRETASRKRWLRSQSVWDCLLALGRSQRPTYLEYSYVHHADLYQLAASPEQVSALAAEAARLAPRELQARLRCLPETARIIFVCPR